MTVKFVSNFVHNISIYILFATKIFNDKGSVWDKHDQVKVTGCRSVITEALFGVKTNSCTVIFLFSPPL